MIATKPTASKAATNGHAPASSGVNLRRKTSLAAGVLYLLTFVSMPTLVLYGPVKTANYILGAGPDTGVLFGGILEIIVALAGIGTAVALFPVLKRQNEGIAMAFVGNRVLEAATIFAGVQPLGTVAYGLLSGSVGLFNAIGVGALLVGATTVLVVATPSFRARVSGLEAGRAGPAAAPDTLA